MPKRNYTPILIASSGAKCVSYLFLFCCSCLLTGCSKPQLTATDICHANPNMCGPLATRDKRCQTERDQIIFLRHHFRQAPSDLIRFDELLATKAYAKCMAVAAQIQTTTLKATKTARIDALLYANDMVDNIENELRTSPDPNILYYRWTQGDYDALAQFLQLESTNMLNTPTLQLALASYYFDKDLTHTITILLTGLRFYDGSKDAASKAAITDIIKALATINHQLENRDHAYLWSRVGKNFDIRVANENQLIFMYPMPEQKRVMLRGLASEITNKIKTGQFNVDLLPPITTGESAATSTEPNQ